MGRRWLRRGFSSHPWSKAPGVYLVAVVLGLLFLVNLIGKEPDKGAAPEGAIPTLAWSGNGGKAGAGGRTGGEGRQPVVFGNGNLAAIPAGGAGRSNGGGPTLSLNPQVFFGAWAKSALANALPFVALTADTAKKGPPASLGISLLQLFTGFNLADPYSWISTQLPWLEILGSSEPEWVAPPSPVPGTGEGEQVFPAPVPREEEIQPPVLTGKEPLIGIYHTHSRESYLPEFPNYKRLKPDDAHTYDLSKTVVRVGEELARTLNEKYGLGVVQSRYMNDREGKLGAYVRSLVTAQKLLKDYPTIRVLLDIHRDSQRRAVTTTTIGGQPVARVMLVIGKYREAGEPSWEPNDAFAHQIVRVMDAKYPGLSRGIYYENYRFNQHLLPGSVILEVGGVDNTLEESLRAARLMADVLVEVLREGQVPGR